VTLHDCSCLPYSRTYRLARPHVTTFDNPDSARLLQGQANVTTVKAATTDYYRLDVNAVTSIFRDDRLRQALSLAIDRDKIGDVAVGGTGRPTAAVALSFPGGCDPAAMPYGTPDRARNAHRHCGAPARASRGTRT
jgi:peptide/nickel transport system substrate-binding protein